MSPEWVSALADILMVFVTMTGFIFIYKQIQVSAIQNRASAIEHLYNRMHDIHKIFIENPVLCQKFYNPNPTSETSHDMELLVLVEMMADFFQQVYLELDHLPQTAVKGWKSYMKVTLQKSPELQHFIISNNEWYEVGFVEKLLDRT